MKKPLLLLTGLGVFLFFSLNHLSAQDKKPAKVTITITEDDKVTTDTTFELKEGQDPEMIKKIVSKIAGEDIKINISKSMSHSTIAMIHSDDDVEWHAKKSGDFEYHFGDLGMDLDSIKRTLCSTNLDRHANHEHLFLVPSRQFQIYDGLPPDVC